MFNTKNLILNTDSYKASHFLQYPPGTSGMFSYLESRGGLFDKTVFFGLQAIIKEYLMTPITLADIIEAEQFFKLHGEPFDRKGWDKILNTYRGYLPVTIKAVPEGTVVPTSNVLVTVECDDPDCFWIASYIESLILRVWYPTTVATLSWHIKQDIKGYLDRTSDTSDGLSFKLHDFGARGCSSGETAVLGGMAHLVNFMGSDTVLGIAGASKYYGEVMAGFSIPAAEHSTITSWGRDSEYQAFENMIDRFSKPGALFAVVSDSYDLLKAIDAWGTKLKTKLEESGGTLIVRPDSGDPVKIVAATVQRLDKHFGSTTNTKGFKVLNNVRVIQGDGVDRTSINAILERLATLGYSADNIAFGMGGALLQQVNRDTQKFAFKCSSVTVNGKAVDVFKAPATDPGKTSKKGIISLYKDPSGRFVTERVAFSGKHENQLRTVFYQGTLLINDDFASIRKRAS